MTTPAMLTIAELAQHLQVSTATVRRMIKAGNLKAVHVGRNVRIPAEELTRIMDSGVAA